MLNIKLEEGHSKIKRALKLEPGYPFIMSSHAFHLCSPLCCYSHRVNGSIQMNNRAAFIHASWSECSPNLALSCLWHKSTNTSPKMSNHSLYNLLLVNMKWLRCTTYNCTITVCKCQPGVAVVTLCSDVLSTSWNGEGSIRICSISTGLSSSSSSQALICNSQSQGRKMDSEYLSFFFGWFVLLLAAWCWINKILYLLWGHGVGQCWGRGLLKKDGNRKSEGQMDG